MALLNVAAFHRILEMRTELDVDPNAFIIRIVPAEWRAYDSIAEIHAQVYAVRLLNVTLPIMFQSALARETIKVIHSPVVEKSQ